VGVEEEEVEVEVDSVEEVEVDSASGVVLLPGLMLAGVEEACPDAVTSLVAPVRRHRGHISRYPCKRECQLLLGMRPIRLR